MPKPKRHNHGAEPSGFGRMWQHMRTVRPVQQRRRSEYKASGLPYGHGSTAHLADVAFAVASLRYAFIGLDDDPHMRGAHERAAAWVRALAAGEPVDPPPADGWERVLEDEGLR
jgi:hypothetical protein